MASGVLLSTTTGRQHSMGNNVFANGREIACKSGRGKVIAAFPDVCFTPPDKVPPTPPGVPIPYPLTSVASDTNDGTKSVIISKKEVMLRDASNFKKCMGDNAAQTAKKGIINGKITGKVIFTSWSMDVKIQKKNAVRHLDTMTSNHSSPNANAAIPMIYQDMPAEKRDNCIEQHKKAVSECKDAKPHMVKRKNGELKQKGLDCSPSCKTAQACVLVPKKDDKKLCCHPATTGDHLVEASSYSSSRNGTRLVGCEKYNVENAPTCCVAGGAYSKDHGFMSALRGEASGRCPPGTLKLSGKQGEISAKHVTTQGEAKDNGARSVRSVYTQCEEECIRAQLDVYDKEIGNYRRN